MDNTQKLIELFKQFPGIGPRQAKRFVYFLLNRQNGYTKELADLISTIRSQVHVCDSCFRFFQNDASGSTTCPVCADTRRDSSALMLVSHDVDFENIEKTKSFQGYYFVLGGTVPILEKTPEMRIRQRELLDIVEKRVSRVTLDTSGLKEIIIALNYNPEGENTLMYLQSLLRPLAEKYSLKISTLGRGLSTGTELEYSDTETIKNALKNRQ
jgi:recombination protein RecR